MGESKPRFANENYKDIFLVFDCGFLAQEMNGSNIFIARYVIWHAKFHNCNVVMNHFGVLFGNWLLGFIQLGMGVMHIMRC